MHLFPILSALRRHRAAAALIVLEIAFTCAILCNAIFLISERLSRIARPSGLVEDELIRVRISEIGNPQDAAAVTARDLVALRALPGVRFVAVANMVPFGGSASNTSMSTIPDDPSPPLDMAMYMGSSDLLETMGVRLTAGRDFAPEEYVDLDAPEDRGRQASIIITRDLAERAFPGRSPLGQRLYAGGSPQIVIGVIDRLARPNDLQGADAAAYAVLVPVNIAYTVGGNYLLRVDPDRREEVLGAVDATLQNVDPGRIITERQTFAQIREAFFKQDRAMAYLLGGVSIALLIVTALGIIGLASFWVQQRARQIGIRRGLGATRGDIFRYFQLENFILATLGITAGMGLAYAFNRWLMDSYQVPRLPAGYLPVGASLLWFLGQIAVLGPTLRASKISPAIATRTV
jgi:putative ABC transport system permease protein